jgi:RNA polymerase sigma-70 factor (sigma-E family)
LLLLSWRAGMGVSCHAAVGTRRHSGVTTSSKHLQEEVRVESFDEFAHATGRRMHQAALLLCGGDHHLAEDLTQVTYTKVYASWRRVSAADDPVAYTRTVLTRTYLSHRRLGRSKEQPTAVFPDRVATSDGDQALRHDLLTALALLKPQDRVVLVLRYWEDRSVADTADVLGLSEAAVRQRARRALEVLRGHLPDLDLNGPSTDVPAGQEAR